MVRSSLLLVPLVAVIGAWMGRSSGAGSAAVPLAAILGLLAALAIASAVRVRMRDLSLGVNAWMGKTDVEPVVLGGSAEAEQLATALNSLGAAYARRGQRLEATEPQVRDLVAALPEPALLFGDDLELEVSNAQAFALFAGSRAPGTTVATALGSAALSALVRDVVADGRRRELRATVGAKTIEAVATPFFGRVLLLARDRTEDVRIEVVRRDFVANASHELKTPVAGIQSLADALAIVLDKDPEKARHLVGRVHGEAERLAALVSDLLSLRRVDDDTSAGQRRAVDLSSLATGIVAELGSLAADHGVTLEVEAGSDADVLAVSEDLGLIVGNLVENAVRYNRPGGRVDVRVRRHGVEVLLEVQDTGIGIPGKDLDRIFERFYRVDPGRSREAGGTGLGLSIVRHAAERNGGRVEVTSLLGQGSTFRVALPAADALSDEGQDAEG